jgi:hypothetical protein
MEISRIYKYTIYATANLRPASLKFKIYITAGIYSIVFGLIYFSETSDLNIELLTITMDNIWKLCGL